MKFVHEKGYGGNSSILELNNILMYVVSILDNTSR